MREVLKEYTLLYAEDDLALQKDTAEYLKRYFKEVYVVDDGKEALEKYVHLNPDVLLLDIDMPYKDGITLARKIRQTNKNIPILMLTAHTDVDKLLKAIELNLCKYLVKPVTAHAFKEALGIVATHLKENSGTFLTLNDGYSWDRQKEMLFCRKSSVDLTAREQSILKLLIKHHQHSVSFEEIMAVAWEDNLDAEVSIDAIKFHIAQLRKKLPKGSIKSIYGKGFILI